MQARTRSEDEICVKVTDGKSLKCNELDRYGRDRSEGEVRGSEYWPCTIKPQTWGNQRA